jgi:SAM-dependent methyltransferase
MYKYLAPYYDSFFGGYHPRGMAARERLLRFVMPHVGAVCDLCCGTGITAIEFAKRGLRVCGVDLSAEMCRAARANIREAGVRVRVIQADMRDFRLPEPVDLVTCEFDALNHVPERSDLRCVLDSVARALRPGGWFYFDVNNRPAFQKVWPLTSFFERPGVAAVFHGGYDGGRDPDRAWIDMEFFVGKRNVWRRYRDHVEEVCWSGDEMRSALEAAGFGEVKSWDGKRFFPGDRYMGRGHRTFYLAKAA